jgi:phosphoribosylformylglycinamidine synthase
MALAGNGRWTYLDPKLGAMHAVAEAARKVACTGATPVSATNCLNFGNPEKPEIMAQLSAAIDGIAEACTALGTPITGGNVSLYNETKGVGIYPTPVVGIVGIIDDVTKAVPSSFRKTGESVLQLYPTPLWARTGKPLSDSEYKDLEEHYRVRRFREYGSSEYARQRFGTLWGNPPEFNVQWEASLHKLLVELADKSLISSAFDVSDGGLAVALVRAALVHDVGIVADVIGDPDTELLGHLFAEDASTVVVSCDPEREKQIRELAQSRDIQCLHLGKTVSGMVEISVDGALRVSETITELRKSWAGALEAQIAEELVTA